MKMFFNSLFLITTTIKGFIRVGLNVNMANNIKIVMVRYYVM